MDLFHAIRDNDKVTVETLIDKGADINARYNSETPLTFALENGKVEIALIIANCRTCDLEKGNQNERTPLFCAAKCGHKTLVEYLLKRGVNVDKQDLSGVTPLGATAWYNKADVAEVLIRAGADINQRSNNGETPLHRACDNVSDGVVDVLLRHGCDVNIPTVTRDGVCDSTPLMAAIPSKYERNVRGKKMSTMIEILKNILSHRANTDAVDIYGNTALHITVERNEIHAAFLLMESNCSTSIINGDGLSPLHMALLPDKQFYQMAFFLILFGFPDVKSLCNECDENQNWMNLLLKGKRKPVASEAERHMIFKVLTEETSTHGSVLTNKNKVQSLNNNNIALPVANGFSDVLSLQKYINAEIPLSLQKACRQKIRKCLGRCFLSKTAQLELAVPLKRFLIHGLDVKTCHPVIACELQMAIVEGDIDKLKSVIDGGLDVNTVLFGKPPLVIAAENGQSACVKVLLHHNANPMIQDVNGDSALHLASKFGHDEIIKLLFPLVNDVNLKNAAGNTPLHEACSNGKFTSAVLILENGGDPSFRDSSGMYPIHYAAGSGDVNTVSNIIGRKSSIELLDRSGNNALHAACSRGLIYLKENIPLPAMFSSEIIMNLDMCRLMYSLDFSVCADFTDNVNHLECIKLLLDGNCDYKRHNNDHKSAFQIAQYFGFGDITELLENHKIRTDI